MTKLIARFAKDESGATAIEYGLIAALLGLAVMAGANLLATELNDLFTRIANAVGGVEVNDGTP